MVPVSGLESPVVANYEGIAKGFLNTIASAVRCGNAPRAPSPEHSPRFLEITATELEVRIAERPCRFLLLPPYKAALHRSFPPLPLLSSTPPW